MVKAGSVCDAHELLIGALNDIKTELKDIKQEQKKQNDYIVGKKAENGVTTVIAQKQDIKKDSNLKNALQVIMAMVAIAALIIGVIR